MIIMSALRDFADGLSRGILLFLTERPESAARRTTRLLAINSRDRTR
jgi:hypothetical protein